jgi:hypothetical protein
MFSSVIAHGEYPFDSSDSPWRAVKDENGDRHYLTEEEAQALLPEGTQLLNKGFWVIDWAGAIEPSASPLTLACATELGIDTSKGWPVGVRAVYHHDCRFMLIEVVR